MEGIIVLEGTVLDMTGFRDGTAVVKVKYRKISYRNREVRSFKVKELITWPCVDIPYRGARRLENPEMFGLSRPEQPSLDGFGVPVNQLHRDDKVTVYVHWKDVPKFGDRVDRELCEVVIIADDPRPQPLQELIEEVADKLSA